MLVTIYRMYIACLLVVFLKEGVVSVVSSCVESSGTINTTQVARMCHNSVVSGTRVYIDADDAGSTTMSSGVPCTCTVKTQVGKLMKVQSNFTGTPNPTCGTTMEYAGQGLSDGTLSHSCNLSTFNVTTHTYKNISVGLRKVETPYLSTYCVTLELRFCSQGQFQCKTGECIQEMNKCDNHPDCRDESDEGENTCGNGTLVCVEGQILCPGGKGCIAPGGLCNNVSDCVDGSDENNCESETGVNTNEDSATSDASVPLITVTCRESLFLLTTVAITTPTMTTTPTTIAYTATTLKKTTTPTTTPTPTPKTTTILTTPYSPATATPTTITTLATTTKSPDSITTTSTSTTPPWLIGALAVGWGIVAIQFVVIIALAISLIRHRRAAISIKNTEAKKEENWKNPNYDTLVRGAYENDLLEEKKHTYTSVADVNTTTTTM